MGRIDCLRGDKRENIRFEILFQPGLVGLFQIADRRDFDAFLDQQFAQVFKTVLLPVFKLENLFANGVQLLARAEPVNAGRLDAALDLSFETGDPDSGEFIEIAGRNRQKAQPLQQRITFVLTLRQNAPVEA